MKLAASGDVVETDYLVVGAGAAGMAFTDALLTHSDATVTLVDRRGATGGRGQGEDGVGHEPDVLPLKPISIILRNCSWAPAPMPKSS